MFDPRPTALEGRFVRLEPLALSEHFAGLCAVGLDPELWRWTTAKIPDEVSLRRYLEVALAEQAKGTAVPFAVRHLESGRVAGSTRFGNIDRGHRRVEIGWTWLGREFWRTAANTEQKYLMLRHAFERWRVQRVELKTSALNERSRAAMRRIGFVEEGTMRKHMINEDGTARDSVYFSAIDDEWPALKPRLEAMLAR
jgi:RimJ/RimL family protein N-acetyltransferase